MIVARSMRPLLAALLLCACAPDAPRYDGPPPLPPVECDPPADAAVQELCEWLDPALFAPRFQQECRAVAADDAALCAPIERDESRIYCRKNVRFFSAVRAHDRTGCRFLAEDPEYPIFHAPEPDVTLCEAAFDVLTDDPSSEDIDALCERLFDRERYRPRCRGQMSLDPNRCWTATGLDDRVKCLVYMQVVDCERLDEAAYIRELAAGTDHVFDTVDEHTPDDP